MLGGKHYGPGCGALKRAQALIKAAVRQRNRSTRGYHRVLKLARTFADLTVQEQSGAAHLAEAIHYRPRRVK